MVRLRNPRITLEWDERRKVWHVSGVSAAGVVRCRDRAENPVPVDDILLARLVSLVASEIESLLPYVEY